MAMESEASKHNSAGKGEKEMGEKPLPKRKKSQPQEDMSSRRVYVGGLPLDVRSSEVKDIFSKFGPIKDVDVKVPRGGPGGTHTFAFVEFEDERDAEDAVRDRDGYKFDGARLRVELSRGSGGGGGGGGGGPSRGPPQRSEYRVVVENLPPGTSWQDLKDFMRKAGDVGFSEVNRDGNGVVEYSNADDMKYAVRKLDDTEFVGNFNRGKSFVRVREERRGGGGGGGGGSGGARRRSPSPRGRSPSPRGARGRSPSPRGDRKASPARSRSPPARRASPSRSPRRD